MRVCIIGAGAMGSIYGALLARSGQEVTLVDTWPAHLDAVQRSGLKLDGVTGELTVKLPISAEPPAGFAEVAFIQTDTNATRAAAHTARHVLHPEGYAITLQNGVGNIEILCEVLGVSRVVGGLSYHSGQVRGPGHISHTHAGPTWLGELDGRTSERVQTLHAALAAAGFKPVIVGDIMGYIWSKFIHNCAINPICAVTGLRVGEVSTSPSADALQTRIIDEALAVLRAKGIALTDPDPMQTIKDFCRAGKYNKPSMLQHIEAGKRTEIDSLNGAIVREGRALGIAAPYNEALTWLVKSLEAQRQQQLHGEPIDYDALAKKETKP